MSHDTHVIDGFNKDMGMMGPQEAFDHYLGLAEGWRDPYPDPVVCYHDGVLVVRDDLLGDGVGTKARAADLVISRCESDTIVYVQPRVGLAGLSVLDVARRHGKRVVLFMPASRRISHHQACTIERGAEPIFRRVAAMPNLNAMAKVWAEENGAYFVPLGLRHPLATAAIVRAASTVEQHPQHAWVATSTGVLTRALQIAWPGTRFTSIAVARNMKEGELGRADVVSEPVPFLRAERQLPPFPSVSTYDAKVWKYIPKQEDVEVPSSLMWNVGKDPVLQDEGVYDRVESNADWVRK